MIVRSDGVNLFYSTKGDGAPVVLLHPFPFNHRFWFPVAEQLASHYKLVLPDLRGLGSSGVGDDSITLVKHAEDLRRICDEERIGKATFVGVSIGGYVMFEFWRRFRERVNALALCNTRADAESEEGKKVRQEAVKLILERGTEMFVENSIPRLLGETTRRNRPDIVEEAGRIMLMSSGKGMAANQMAIAGREDSTPILATIDVPTLFVGADEDLPSPLEQIEKMHRAVAGSRMRVIRGAGHCAAFEKPGESSDILREFLGTVAHTG